MKEETLAIILVCALAFGGFGYLFTSLTSDINQPVAANPRAERVVSQEPVAPPANTLEQEGWHQIGGPSILANADETAFLVNFNRCDAGGTTVEFPSGPLTFTLHGLTGNDCHLSYHFDDKDVSCDIPASLGQLRFTSSSTPNLSTIERYCEAG
jgi:hypothetical protein